MSYANLNEGKKLVNPNHPNAISTSQVETDLQLKFPDLLFPYMKQDHVAGVNSNVHAWCDKHQAFTRLSVAGARHRGTKHGCSMCANEHKGGSMPEGVSKRYNTAGYIGRVGVQSGIFRAVKAVFPDAIWEYRMENGKEIDIYVPSIKAGIEYNGNYYHSDAVQKDNAYHLKKTLAGLKEGGTAILHVLTEEAIEPYDNLVHTLKELAGPRSPTIPATPIETNIKFKVLGSVAAAEFHQRYNFRKLCTGYAACTYHVGMFTATGELLAVASAHLDETKDLFYILQLTLKDSRYTQAIPALSFATSELSGMSKYRFAVLASLCNPLEVFQILSALSQIPPKYTGPVPHWLDSSYKLDDNLTSENATARIWDAGYLVFLLR